MSFSAKRRQDGSIEMVGPLGDTLAIHVTRTSGDIDWSGRTWTGTLSTSPSGTVSDEEFDVTDSSTSEVLDVDLVLGSDVTAGLTAGVAYFLAIKATTSGSPDVVETIVRGEVRFTETP